jgi:hypothetical protein
MSEGGSLENETDTQINHTADKNVGHFATRPFCHETTCHIT